MWRPPFDCEKTNFPEKNVFPENPTDSKYLKTLDIRLWEVGAKRHLSGTSKVNTHTDK